MTTHTIDLQLALPQALVDRITRAAAASQTSVSDVIATTVDHALPAVPDLPPDLWRELLAMLDYSDAALQSAMRLRISPADDQRLRELTAKSKAGQLSPRETSEMDGLLDRNDRSVLIRAQALAILRRRGFAVPSLDEQFEDKAALA